MPNNPETRGSALKTGEILVEAGLVRDEDIRMALEIQGRHHQGKTPPLMGSILCNWNMITPVDLYLALDRYGKLMKIGDILVRQGKLVPSELEETLTRQTISPKPFGKILVDAQAISDHDVQQALSVQANLPFIRHQEINCTRDRLETMAFFTGIDFVRVTGIVPVDYSNHTLTLALSRPSHLRGLNASMTGNVLYRIRCVLVTRERHGYLLSKLGRPGFGPMGGRGGRCPGDIVDGQGDMPALDSLLVIREPTMETLKLDAMYHRYHMLKAGSLGIADEGQSVLFKEFIGKRHGDIKRRFGCRSVAYQLEKKGHKVLIHAYPAGR